MKEILANEMLKNRRFSYGTYSRDYINKSKSVGKTVYELANGDIVEYPFGLAVIEFMGEITAGRIIFGPDDVNPILGVTALESVGIMVDSANQTLKRLPAIPLK